MELKLLTLFIPLRMRSCDASTVSQDTLETERFQTAIKSLNQDSSFIFFDLMLSPEELTALERIKINFPKEYNNLGALEVLRNEVIAYVKSLGNKEERVVETVSQMIHRIACDCVRASGKATAWVALRASQQNSDFDLARWHVDGYYYQPYFGQYKFAFTFKGPGTKFYKLPKQMREKFTALLQEGNRQKLSKLLYDSRLVMQAQSDQGTVFIVGADNAAVHSEPPINEERLFMSVLPGSKEQIAEWKQNGFKGH